MLASTEMSVWEFNAMQITVNYVKVILDTNPVTQDGSYSNSTTPTEYSSTGKFEVTYEYLV